MTIKGDFTQNTQWNSNNFDCSGTHKVIFSGAEKHTIYFSSSSSGFNDVEFYDKTEISNVIRGWVLQYDTVIDNDCILNLAGTTLDLNGYTLIINGNLQQTSGTIKINGGTLDIKGDYSIDNGEYNCYAYLNMSNDKDSVNVGGDFLVSSYGSGSVLTAGTMTIKGDFTQNTQWNSNNFNCSGTHKVIFDGNDTQTVHFDSTSSRFNILELTKDKETGYIFDPDNCWNELIEHQEQLIGDTNLDRTISISDVTAIQRHLAELETFTDEQLALADTNGDGEINIADATHLQKYLAEFDGIVLGKQTA